MDGDTSTSQQDQISLYGLFGDTNATLQGLNDQLTPSLLQQSPPCGSNAPSSLAASRAISVSPLKGSLNGIQHGILLSDFADRSPSAGSVTASLCNHVSFDNLRCMNLISIKDKRYCSQHSGDSTPNLSTAKKAIFERATPTVNTNKAIGFVPVAPKLSGGNVFGAKLDVKSVARGTIKANVDVPDNISANQKAQQLCFVRKVGQQITVTTKSSSSVKATDSGILRQPVASPQNVGMKLHPSAKVQLTKPLPLYSTSKANPHFNKKLAPAMAQIQSVPVTFKAPTTRDAGSNIGVKAKAQAMDEDMIRKLIEVLNSKSDLSPQQQISLLQSMGVTVVHTSPSGNNSPAAKRKPTKIATGKITTPKPKISVQSGTLTLAQNGFVHPNYALNSASNVKSQTTVQGGITNDVNHPISTIKIKKVESKVGQKRKKPSDAVSAKKSKTIVQGDVVFPKPTMPNVNKKVKPNRALTKSKQTKQSGGAMGKQTTLMSGNPPPYLLRASSQTNPSVVKLAQHMNEKIILNHDIFSESGKDVDVIAVDNDKSKTLKFRLLKRHVSEKRRSEFPRTEKFDYSRCIKDINGTDFVKLFSAARDLLRLLQCEVAGKRSSIHHEAMLDDLVKTRLFHEEGKRLEGTEEPANPENLNYDERSTYTLETMHLKNEYKRLEKQWNCEEKEFKMFLNCYKEDPNATMQLVNSLLYSSSKKSCVKTSMNETLPIRKCRLASADGIGCSMNALPYSDYCKQHIWHCQSQCLFKLDQNMKPAADISPEPLVKKTRKRPKLLPLIKRYKKKKKKRPDVAGNLDVLKTDQSIPLSTMDRKDEILLGASRQTSTSMATKESFIGANIKVTDSDLDDNKPSDTSEDDLSLTTAQEIMLSGVLDKLSDDPHEFDLFTDKGAEELERALLLAASSPPPGQENDVLGMPSSHSTSNIIPPRRSSMDFLDTAILSNSKLNHSPDAVVNCDAPKSSEQPPSLESLTQTQIAHYTFGSNVQQTPNKKDVSADNYAVEDDASATMISAEDLRDIEGVLEKLHAEDVNSPKLPSSPAIDQYTSMLARQLSQEVEGESLKQESPSTPVLPSTTNNFSTPKVSSQSFSLQASIMTNSILDGNENLVKAGSTVRNGSILLSSMKAQTSRQDSMSATSTLSELLPSINMKGVDVSQALATSQSPFLLNLPTTSTNPRPKLVAHSVGNGGLSSSRRSVSNVGRKVSATIASTMKLPKTMSVNSSTKTPQRTSSSSQIATNSILPVTLMQGTAQNGNVIKVIVPPGMVNGTNTQQNMLLIPVSALMKQNPSGGNIPGPNIQSPSTPTVNAKTQLSALQAGQQFFIVNNTPGSSQAHLALLQKPVGGTTTQQQQNIFLKPAQRSVALQKDDAISAAQKQGLNLLNQIGMKSNLTQQLKNSIKQNKISAVSRNLVDGRMNGLPSTIGNTVLMTTTVTGVSNKIPTAADLKKLSMPTQGGRRGKGRSAPRKPRAKFDPITKKYVAITSTVPDVQPVPISTISHSSLATSNKMSESLKKFNQSTLSIQNKVQQIDSVLSSLNAAKHDAVKLPKGLANGHQDIKTKTKGVSWTVRSVVYPTDNNSILLPGVAKTTAVKVAPSVTATVPQVVSRPQLTKVPQTETEKTDKQNNARMDKPKAKQEKKVNPTSANSSPTGSVTKITDSKSPVTPVSSGTVHWNQTTTAGPEITTTTLTVPVYITGAIQPGAWPGEIALSGSVPVLLPTRKITPNCQVPQRVLLGNIGSLAVPTRVRMATGAAPSSLLKQSVISVPQTVNKTTPSPVTVASTAVTTVAGDSINSVKMVSPPRVTLQQITGGVSTNAVKSTEATPVVSTSVSLADGGKTAEVSPSTRKKTGRKASHDTILHDPHMYDPTTPDRAPSDAS